MSIDKRKLSLEKNVGGEVIDQFERIVNAFKAIGGLSAGLAGFIAVYQEITGDIYDKIPAGFFVGFISGVTGLTIGYCVGRMIASSYLQKKYPRKKGFIDEWEKSTRGLFK